MVYNKNRKGWEMPGGKVEEGETVVDAAKREFAEEAGCDVDIFSVRDLGYCYVCAAELGERICVCEMESRLFDSVPDELSFDREEYEDVVPWAKEELKKRIGRPSASSRV